MCGRPENRRSGSWLNTSSPWSNQGPQAFPSPDNFAPPSRDGFYELHHVVS